MGDKYFYSLDGPLDSIPALRQMRAANLQGYPDLVKSMGADPGPFLERHEIDPHVLRDPDRYINCKAGIELFEYTSEQLKAPLFGLQLAQIQSPEIFGCVTTLCRAAPTVRQAIMCFIEYIPVVHSPAAILELAEGATQSELRWHVGSDFGCNVQANYKGALLNVKLLQMLCGTRFKPDLVKLAAQPRKQDIGELESLLNARFGIATEENSIAFASSFLDQPVTTANRLVYKLLGGYLEQVKAASRTELADRVEDYIRGNLSSRDCCIERCALKLDISVRTLQARLSSAGLNFSDLLEKLRLDVATQSLEQPALSLEEIADMLGYAEQSSFGRAFKRWTGKTPNQFRQQLTAGNSGRSSSAIGKLPENG